MVNVFILISGARGLKKRNDTPQSVIGGIGSGLEFGEIAADLISGRAHSLFAKTDFVI
jgi:hypothetical protein